MKITRQEVFKIFAKRNTPNLKFIYYEPDNIGFVEIFLKGKQIFCAESGKLKDQVKSLKKEIVQRQKELEKLQDAVDILESYEGDQNEV